jgi:hypothetical protein
MFLEIRLSQRKEVLRLEIKDISDFFRFSFPAQFAFVAQKIAVSDLRR